MVHYAPKFETAQQPPPLCPKCGSHRTEVVGRSSNGDTLISDQFNNRVIRVNRAGHIVASYGLPLAGGTPIGNNAGYDVHSTQRGLYAPYDAKIIGDYTGLTPPSLPTP